MRLSALTIQNWMSWAGKHQWDPGVGLVVINGDNRDTSPPQSNGAGKSALFYAIVWGLWGKLPRKHKKDDLITNGYKKCSVHLVLESKDTVLEITRTKQKTLGEKLEFKIGDKVVAGDLLNTQIALEEWFHISFETFCNVIYIGRESASARFFEASPTQRMAILSELIEDTVFREAGKRVGKDITKLVRENDKDTASISSLQQVVDRLSKEAVEVNRKLHHERKQQQAEVHEKAHQIAELEKQQIEIQKRIRDCPEGDESALREEVAIRSTKIRELQNQSAILSHQVRTTTLPPGSKCSTCGQTVTEEFVAGIRQKQQAARDELRKINNTLTDLQAEHTQYQEELNKILRWHQQKEKYRQQMEDLNARIYQVREAAYSRAVEYLEENLKQIEENINNLHTQIADLKRSISQRNKHLPVLKALQAGFNREIRNMLLDEVRQVLTHYTNRYTPYMAGSEFSITYPPQTNTGRETFDIVVKRGPEEVGLPSGGERYRISIACLLALRQALQFGRTCPFDFLLLDDPVGELDDPGCHALSLLLRDLNPDIQTIMMTVPREMKLEGHRDVLVVKQEGKSRIG